MNTKVKADAYTGELALNKTALTLKELAGIDVYSDKQKGQIKDMVEILDELYARWGDFTEEQQLGLAEAIAGKQQSKVFQSLMTNYKDVLAVREQLANQEHFGSAEAENSQYLDSISGKLNTLKQTWISILDTFANSESIKSALDVLISVSEAIDSIVKALDDAGILMHATFGALGSGGNLLKSLAGFGETSYQIKQVGDSLELVSTKAKSGTPMIKSVFNSFKEGQTVSQKLSGGFKAVGTSITSSLIPSLKGMLSAGLKGVAVAVAFDTISWAIDKTINKYKNLDKELQTQANTSKSQLESLNKQKSGLESIAEEYDKLSQKSKKTAEEVERYNELKNQIAELAPELVIGLDDDNNPILNLNGSLETYIGNLDSAIERQKTLFANDSLAVGKNALDSLNSSLNWNLAHTYEQDDLALSKQNDAIVSQRQKLVNRLNKINNEYNFKSFEQELSDYAKQSEKYNKAIVEGHQKVQKEHAKITEETVKAQQGMNTKLMDTSAMKQASEETKKLGAQMISAFDLSEVDSNKLDQMVFNMSKNLSSGEFDSSLKKVAELRQELEKTYNFKEYEENIEQYIPSVAKFLGVTEDMARNMLKVPEIMKSSEDALDEFLRSVGKTKQSLNFDVETQNLANQFYEVENALSQLTNTNNLVKIDGKIQLDPQVVLDMQNNESIPEQIRNLLGEFNKDGVVDFGEIKLLMDVMTAFKLGNTQESQDILKSVQEQLDELLGEGVIDIKDLKFDVNGKVENVNIDKKELEEKLSVFGDREEIKAVFRADVVGLDKVDLFAEIVKKLPADKEYTTKFIADNAEALSSLNSYQEVIDWIAKNPEVINTYKIDVTGNEKLEKAKQDFENSGGEKTQKVNVETNAEDAKKTLEETNKQADELSKDINLSVNDGELQGSVESFNKLIEYSSKIKDGEYKLSFTSDTGESITQINNLKDAVNKLSSEFSSLPSITVKIETALASQNVTGLRNNIEGFNDLAGGLKTLVFSTDTERASKNVTGLRNNVDSYIKERAGKNYSTKFSTQTALASQNVTGLRRNVDSYVKSYGGQTIKTTFKIVTEKVTKTTTVASSTNKNNSSNKGDTFALQRSVDNVSVASEPAQVDTAPVTREGASPQDAGATARVSTTPTLPTPIAITGGDIYNSMKYNVNLIKELENRIDSVSNSLATLDAKMEKAIGKDKIKYLQQQNTLYQEQLALQKELEDKLVRQQNYYKYFLETKGVKFNADGNATNYEELLLKKEKELEALEKKANQENATDSQKKAYENAKDALDELKDYADAYFKVTFSELPKVTEEWESISNAIKDNAEAIKTLQREQELYTKNTKLREIDMLLDEVNDKQELLNEEMSVATGEEKIKYQNEYNELLEKENKLQEERIKQYEDSLAVYQKELNAFGVAFDENGTVKNLSEVLNKHQNSESLEYLNKLLDEYFTIQRDELPDARKEWQATKNEIDSTTESVKTLKNELKNLHEDSGYKDHNRDLAEVENKLAINQIHLDNSTGKNQIEYLEQRISLTHQLKKETQDLLDYENSRRKSLMSELSQYGFNFRSDGSIVGYGGQIAQLKQTLSDDEFEEVFSKVEDYINTTNKTIPELQQSLEEIGYSIEDYKDELEDLLRQRYLDPHINKVKELENEYDKLSDTLDIVEIKLKHAVGKEKLDLLDEQIKLLEEQRQKQSELVKEYEAMARVYQRDLKDFGIKFDVNGDITNLDEVLNEYQDHKDIEKLKKLVDEYLDIQRDKIPDIKKEWESLSSAIKDAYKEQLSTAQDMEEKITSMYKKQIQDRIDAMNKETDAKIKALKKQKEAYNKYRDEVEYKNDYNEKLDEINDLQRQLDIAMRDTSLNGQQKVKELQSLLAEAQKELDKLTQDKIDSDINDLYDKESERIEEENKNAIDKIEEEWSDSKIAQMVAEALGSGVFTDIEGNVHDLEDALINFAEETGELFGVMGAVIKSELITNLEIAKDTVQELGNILKELDLSSYAIPSTALGVDNIGTGYSAQQVSNQVVFESSLINIEGNVDASVVDDLKAYGEQLTKDIIDKIYSSIR